MTCEKMAELINSDPDDFKDLLPVLWKKCSSYLFKLATNFYLRHKGLCMRSGIELEDLKAGCYEAFLQSIQKYDPSKEPELTKYFSVKFKSMAHSLLNIDTERGYNDPLRNHVSTDAHYTNSGTGEECENTILNYIPDEDPPVDTAVEDKLINYPCKKQDRIMIRQALRRLPQKCKMVIYMYYYDELPEGTIAKELGIKSTMVRSIREKSLNYLKKDPDIVKIHERIQIERKPPENDSTRAVTLAEWAKKEKVRRRVTSSNARYELMVRTIRETALSYLKKDPAIMEIQNRIQTEWSDREKNGAGKESLLNKPIFAKSLCLKIW